jgi:hypothetical protein
MRGTKTFEGMVKGIALKQVIHDMFKEVGLNLVIG